MQNRTRTGGQVLIALLLVLSADAALANGVRLEWSRSLPATGTTLTVDTSLGSVTINGTDGSTIEIRAAINASAGTQEQARALAGRIRIETASARDGVGIRTIYPDESVIRQSFQNVSYGVDYTIAVPRTLRVRVTNRFGPVSISRITRGGEVNVSHGPVTVSASSGTVQLSNRFGPSAVNDHEGQVVVVSQHGPVAVKNLRGEARVENRFGPVKVEDVSHTLAVNITNGPLQVSNAGGTSIQSSLGPVEVTRVRGDLALSGNGPISVRDISRNARIESRQGDVEVEGIGGELRVKADNAKIFVRRVDGAADVRTTFGAIEVDSVAGHVTAIGRNGAVTLTNLRRGASVEASFGLVRAENVQGPLKVRNENGGVTTVRSGSSIDVQTSFAPIFINGVAGTIRAVNQNGAVSIEGVQSTCQDIHAEASFAPVRVVLPRNASYRVTAATAFGTVRSDLPISVSGGDQSRERISGTIGSGRCSLDLINRNGNIEIEAR